MDMQIYRMKDRLKQKDLFIQWKPVSQKIEDYFTKHHPYHHHKENFQPTLYGKCPN